MTFVGALVLACRNNSAAAANRAPSQALYAALNSATPAALKSFEAALACTDKVAKSPIKMELTRNIAPSVITR